MSEPNYKSNCAAPVTRIVVLRHGEAAVYAPSDHERPLTAYGHASLQASLPSLVAQLERLMEESVRERGVARLEVRVSDALRTMETWDILSPELEALCRRDSAWSLHLKVDPTLYLASAPRLYQELLALECEQNESIGLTLMYIGHNPGLSELLVDLAPICRGGAPRAPLAPGEFACLVSDGQQWSVRLALD